MAVKNRPTVGTVHCEHCDGTRSVHQYESGRHKGKLYTRCPSCDVTSNKFISKMGDADQTILRSQTQFKPEFAHLAEAVTPAQTPTPQQPHGVTPDSVTPKPQSEDPKPQTTKTRKGGGLFVAGVAGILLLLAGAASL